MNENQKKQLTILMASFEMVATGAFFTRADLLREDNDETRNIYEAALKRKYTVEAEVMAFVEGIAAQ